MAVEAAELHPSSWCPVGTSDAGDGDARRRQGRRREELAAAQYWRRGGSTRVFALPSTSPPWRFLRPNRPLVAAVSVRPFLPSQLTLRRLFSIAASSEELGGNSVWVDRFLARFSAFFYYFMTVAMYMLSPRMAYHFSECVERHAYSTYDKFLKVNGD